MSLKNKKGGSKKIFALIFTSVLILAIASVVAQTALNNDNNSDNIQEVGELSESEKQQSQKRPREWMILLKVILKNLLRKEGLSQEI